MERLRRLFPGLSDDNSDLTSPETDQYNCIAWAAEDQAQWWSPTPGYFWPEGVDRSVTIEAFVQAFATLGYEVSPDDSTAFEEGFEKVVLYGHGQRPTHMARQLSSGLWTSKCGKLEDISHSVDGLCGDEYGEPIKVLRRRRS